MSRLILGPPAHSDRRSGRILTGCGRDTGAIAVWTLGIVLLTYFALAVIVDAGEALAAKTSTLDIAQQAARAGAGQLDLTVLRRSGTLQLDPDAAQLAASTFLARAGAGGTVTASAAGVHVTAVVEQPTVLLRVAGVNSLSISATADAEPSTT